MFKKQKRENELFDKILHLLSDSHNWTRKDLVYYYNYNNLQFAIEWGEEPGYECTYSYRKIIKPIEMKIPLRYRKRFKKALSKITERENSKVDNIEFLSGYLDGEYKTQLPLNNKQISKISIWLKENDINEIFIEKNKIWFKKQEDALAFKLRWTDDKSQT